MAHKWRHLAGYQHAASRVWLLGDMKNTACNVAGFAM
jgi:hypothetical protein